MTNLDKNRYTYIVNKIFYFKNHLTIGILSYRGVIIMSKQPAEQCNQLFDESLSKNTPRKTNYERLDEEGALEYLEEQLFSVLQERFSQMPVALGEFLEFLPLLYECRPEEYQFDLATLFCEKLQGHDSARVGLIDVLLHVADESMLNNYCEVIIKDELTSVTTKSSFRLKIIELHDKWKTIIKEAKDANSFYKPALEEREAQINQLDIALANKKHYQNPFDNYQKQRLYPDDNLVKTVELILDNGRYYNHSFLEETLIGLSFDEFLVELKVINKQRLLKKLQAHDNTLVGLDFDVLSGLKVLHLANRREPYDHRIFSILKALVLQNSKLLARIGYQAESQAKTACSKFNDMTGLLSDYIKKNAELQKEVDGLKFNLAELRRNMPFNPTFLPSPRKLPTKEDQLINYKKAIKEVNPIRLQSDLKEKLSVVVEENAELKIKLLDLNVKLADAERKCLILSTVEEDNKRLKRQMRQMQHQIESLQYQVESMAEERAAGNSFN